MVEGIFKIYQSQTTAELLVILLSQTMQGAYDVEYVGQGSQGVHTGDFITQNSQTSFAHPSAGSDFVSQVWGHNCYELLLMWSIEPKPQWSVMLHFTHRALAVDACSASWIYLLWDGFNLGLSKLWGQQDFLVHGSQGLFTQVNFPDHSQDAPSTQSHFTVGGSLHPQVVLPHIYVWTLSWKCATQSLFCIGIHCDHMVVIGSFLN